jgi:DNA polymerase elongation subunit (family B)
MDSKAFEEKKKQKIQEIRAYIAQNFKTVYGDPDSVMVEVDSFEQGQAIAKSINENLVPVSKGDHPLVKLWSIRNKKKSHQN